jgi:hypothetical protein
VDDHRDVRLLYVDHTLNGNTELEADGLYWIEGEVKSGSFHKLLILTFASGLEYLLQEELERCAMRTSIRTWSNSLIVDEAAN